jgi:hypothetical protein
MKLIDNATKAWRMFSVQAMSLALVVQAVWVELPADLRDSLDSATVRYITIGLLVAGVLGRLVKQEAIHEDKQGGA